jgi:hypothetical protein
MSVLPSTFFHEYFSLSWCGAMTAAAKLGGPELLQADAA